MPSFITLSFFQGEKNLKSKNAHLDSFYSTVTFSFNHPVFKHNYMNDDFSEKICLWEYASIFCVKPYMAALVFYLAYIVTLRKLKRKRDSIIN